MVYSLPVEATPGASGRAWVNKETAVELKRLKAKQQVSSVQNKGMREDQNAVCNTPSLSGPLTGQLMGSRTLPAVAMDSV